jgi:hypothetical protein
MVPVRKDGEKEMTTVYHYTTGHALSGIVTAGVILREGELGSSAAIYMATYHVFPIPRSVWLTREREMPFTAFPSYTSPSGEAISLVKAVAHDPNRYERWQHAVKGVFRLRFDAEAIGADRYWGGPHRAVLEKRGTLRAFEQVPREWGDDLRAWYHCVEEVPLQKSEGVETWVDGKWVTYSDADLAHWLEPSKAAA